MCAEVTSGEIPVKLGVVSLSVMANVAKSSGMGTQNSVLLLIEPTKHNYIMHIYCKHGIH